MTKAPPDDAPQARTPFPRRLILWAAVFAIGALAGLSVFGAFLAVEPIQKLLYPSGFVPAEPAKVFFNSPEMAAFWFAFAGLLLAGLVCFKRLVLSPWLLMTHLGCLLVLGGAMYGSYPGHVMAQPALGDHKVPNGWMEVWKNHGVNVVFSPYMGGAIAELPFAIRLNELRTEYYPARGPWHLVLAIPKGEGPRDVVWQREGIDWAVGRKVKAASIDATVEVLQYIPHARRVYPPGALADSRPIGAESDPNSSVPAMELVVESPERGMRLWLLPEEGQQETWAPLTPVLGGKFARNDPPMTPSIVLACPARDVRDYKCDLSVLIDGNEVERKTIEVNDPLHYGGYHFYLRDGGESPDCALLDVRSDSGLLAVYAGFAMLTLGVFWGFWFRPAWTMLTKRKD